MSKVIYFGGRQFVSVETSPMIPWKAPVQASTPTEREKAEYDAANEGERFDGCN